MRFQYRQMRGDNECPFRDVTVTTAEFGGRVPESEAWNLEDGCRKARLEM